jgi:CheY-like chemotaxis protein
MKIGAPCIAASILIVEDDPDQIEVYRHSLAHYRLTCVAHGTAALASLQRALPDLILLDHRLGDGELGGGFLPRLKQVAAHVPVIIVSGMLDMQEQLELLQGPGSADYVIQKPFLLPPFMRTVKQALDECGFGEMVRAMRSLERAERLATTARERLFTERLARQYELLKRLRSASEKPNISDLAAEFHVDRHTIRRDLHDLVNRQQLPSVVLDPETRSSRKTAGRARLRSPQRRTRERLTMASQRRSS